MQELTWPKLRRVPAANCRSDVGGSRAGLTFRKLAGWDEGGRERRSRGSSMMRVETQQRAGSAQDASLALLRVNGVMGRRLTGSCVSTTDVALHKTTGVPTSPISRQPAHPGASTRSPFCTKNIRSCLPCCITHTVCLSAQTLAPQRDTPAKHPRCELDLPTYIFFGGQQATTQSAS